MTRVRKSSDAEEDLIEIWLYIADHNPRAADRLLDQFEKRWELLATQPHSGAPREDLGAGLRQVVVGEYLSIYRIEKGTVEILRVLHGRRNIAAEDVIP